MSEGGKVSVRVGACDGEATVEVEDNGMGIAPKDQEQLFDRFFRSSEATERAIPGTGLGLTIAKAIVERHDGSIDVESAPGGPSSGSVRRELTAFVDGRPVGRVRHQLNHEGHFTPIAQLTLDTGPHTVSTRYRQSRARPGESGPAWRYGPLVVAPVPRCR